MRENNPLVPSSVDDRRKEILRLLDEIYHDSGSALHSKSVFQLLVAVMLSAQTNDNQVNKITEKLFAMYPTAADFAGLSAKDLEPLIATCGLYKNKAKNIIATAKILLDEYGGDVPSDKEFLTKLPGVGNKTANVVLSQGFGIPALAVDTHVFRVSQRLGLASGKTPDDIERQLCTIIPRDKWSQAHHWLIWHGRRVCSARNPQCDICPLKDLCPTVNDVNE